MYESESEKQMRESLAGFKVTALSVSEDEGTLYLQGDGLYVQVNTEGDCCSETWFADITGVENLVGRHIASFELVEMPESYNVDDGRTRQESDEAYGIKITTDAGYCDIVYRNSSNGYYGGSVSLSIHEGAAPTNAHPITDDWSA